MIKSLSKIITTLIWFELTKIMYIKAYEMFSSRLVDAMCDAGYGPRPGSWSRLGADIEALRKGAGVESLSTARKYLEGVGFPRRHRMERIADWLGVNVEWLATGAGP